MEPPDPVRGRHEPVPVGLEPKLPVGVEHHLDHIGIDESTENRLAKLSLQLLLEPRSLERMDGDHDCSISRITLGSPPPARRNVSTDRSQEAWRRRALVGAAFRNSRSTSGVWAR